MYNSNIRMESVDIKQIKINLFVTCLIDNLFPQVGESIVKVLNRVGAGRISFPETQTCCGQPAYNSGYRKEAREVAIKFLRDFDDDAYIVCPSGSCVTMVKVFYKELFENDPRYKESAGNIAGRAYEFTDFLTNVIGIVDVGAKYRCKATYHDSCHALRELGINEQPRKLLKEVSGLELVEMDMHDACCGFGGTFSVKYPDVSTAMLREKINCITASGADTVISTDMGCLMNIGGYISRNSLPFEVKHIAEILAVTN